MTTDAVILSEAKNLLFRWPDPSATPQDDTYVSL